MNDKIKMVALDAKDAADPLIDALGLVKGDTIRVMMPHFDRVDDVKVGVPPKTLEFFNSLCTFSKEQLKECGLQFWDLTVTGELWLLPYEWYDSIPDGFELTCIDGKIYPFSKETVDDEMRFGALAYGIIKNPGD